MLISWWCHLIVSQATAAAISRKRLALNSGLSEPSTRERRSSRCHVRHHKVPNKEASYHYRGRPFQGAYHCSFRGNRKKSPHHPGRPCQRSSAAEPIWGLGEPWLWVRPTGRRLADPRTRYETAKFTLGLCMQRVVPVRSHWWRSARWP